MTSTPVITLAMIVKNEEKTLPRLLKSVKPFISKAIIHDTGSTDNTIEVLKKELKDIPHEIKQVKWKSFGENRTDVINEVNDGSYILLADADFEYIVDLSKFKNLTADGYYISIAEDNVIYSLIMLIKSGLKWRYVGKTHEYLDYSGKYIETLHFDTLHIKHHHDGGSRSDKFERDLKLLLEDIKVDPKNTRTAFYLAQTYECLGDKEKAIEWYRERVKLGGWFEEVYVSKLRLGRLLDNTTVFLEAYSYRPERFEALYEAVIRLRNAPKVIIDLIEPIVDTTASSDVLFVEKYIWDFALKFELALAHHNYGNNERAGHLFKELIDSDIPDRYKNFISKIYNPVNLSI